MNAEELQELAETERAQQQRFAFRIAVCAAAGCVSSGGAAVRETLKSEISAAGLSGSVDLIGTGCLGLCHAGPLVQMEHRNESGASICLYQGVNAQNARELVSSHVQSGSPVQPLLCPADSAFFSKQHRIVLENSGRLDLERIESYIALGGYGSLEKALTEMQPQDVIREVTQSGLRGRGGGGYPAGLKWNMVAKSQGTREFVICNADEGDPGAFMDRRVLEGDPHRVLEGMAIAAYAIGAGNRDEGVGVTEAPRGILFHHYKVKKGGLLTWVNLLIATG